MSLPDFKTPEAYEYPAQRIGVPLDMALPDAAGLGRLVVVCDDLFVRDCGGAAEEAVAGPTAMASWGPSGSFAVIDRFRPAPGRTITVYRLAGG